jgi:nucleoside-diphosphate-sugar epimerase
MRALVTGVAGFIGSFLSEKLLKENFYVTGIDNFITGKKENIKEILNEEKFEFVEKDVSNERFIYWSTKYDIIFHFASPASPKHYYKFAVQTMLVNSIGTYNLLEKAKKDRAIFVYASTSEVYGDPLLHPQKETYWGNVNPVGKRSMYDESKRFGEALCMVYLRNFDVDVRIIRIFNTYGPRMSRDDGRVIPNFLTQAIEGKPLTIYGDGNQTRSFCYIDDLINGIMKIATKNNLKGEIINLGNPYEITINELAKIVEKITGKTLERKYLPLPEDDPKKRCPDIKKAQELLNWKPVINFETGLKKTYEYFKMNYEKRN